MTDGWTDGRVQHVNMYCILALSCDGVSCQLRKVYERGVSFSGCLFNAVYDGAALPLWQSVLHKDSRASCCKKPSSTAFPVAVQTLSAAVTFFGFGYISYGRPSLPPFSDSLRLNLTSRTFSPDAVLLLLTGVDSGYCGIFLNGGKLQWHIFTRDRSVSVESRQTYNTGEWYEVSCQSFARQKCHF